MARTNLSPLFRTTTATRNKVDPALAVDVTNRGRPLRFIRITPSKPPDAGQVHTIGLNASTPVLDMTVEEESLKFDFTGGAVLPSESFNVETVYVKAGADGMTFTIEGHV